MASKKQKVTSQKNSVIEFQEPKYRVFNLTEKIFPVPVYDFNKKLRYITLRIQKGFRKQIPPIILESSITPAIKQLLKKGLIRLEPVKPNNK